MHGRCRAHEAEAEGGHARLLQFHLPEHPLRALYLVVVGAFVLDGAQPLEGSPQILLIHDGQSPVRNADRADSRDGAEAAGCDHYLSKPIDYYRLEVLVEKLTKRARAR